jgi:hypothetical protein
MDNISIYHSRKKFYGKLIYWYEFYVDKTVPIPPKFLQVPATIYYEYGGTHKEALKDLKASKFYIIKGEEL